MGQHLLLTIRLHSDGQGTARYHGTWQGAPEWPPAPARVFQALLAGVARGNAIPEGLVTAFKWLESLPPPLIAAPRAHQGKRLSLFVPNNDADVVADPRDVSGIRIRKVIHPTLFEEGAPFLYAWKLPGETAHASVIAKAASDLYQLGRGVDMAWAVGELLDEEALENRLREHTGSIHHPEPGTPGKALACAVGGSLVSLMERHRATRLRSEGHGKSELIFFANAPKPRFLSITYERVRCRIVYELRDGEDDTKAWPWPLHRVVKLVEGLRDGAAELLRNGFPDEQTAIERTLIGRRADGSNPSPVEHRARIIPLASIGHEHVDRAVRRILLEIPSGAALQARDLDWAFSGLELVDRGTGVVGPFVLIRSEADNMLRHYAGPSRRWRSVTAVALPDSTKRRRIDPLRRHGEAKSASERNAEEDRAVAAVHVALKHAGVRGTAIKVRVQREPFDAKGARVEAFAEGTRFAKERLWHVELELDRRVDGPLVIGDGRFLGLGVMAPVEESQSVFAFTIDDGLSAHPQTIEVTRALRRAVLALVQQELGAHVPLPTFVSGHEPNGLSARTEAASHLTFLFDAPRRRLLILPPHVVERRDPTREERKHLRTLDSALRGFHELRAGTAGLLTVRASSVDRESDPLFAASRTWESQTAYEVTRHAKRTSAAEALASDIRNECRRRGLPEPHIAPRELRGVPSVGLVGRAQLTFKVAVRGPVSLGRSRHFGGGLFAGTGQ